jgi:glucose/arabinose dehydrogenase
MIRSFCCFIIACCAFTATAQKGFPSETPTETIVHSHYPKHEDFSPALVSSLKVPDGFEIETAATGLGKPRMMVMGDAGLYITRRDQGDVLLLKDENGDGVFEKLKTVVTDFPDVHGIAIRDGVMYLCSSKILKKATIHADGTLDSLQIILNDLPDGGQHDNRVIAFGPDGLLYITIGSNCNDCKETNPENATVVRCTMDGQNRKIFARGLRNTIGIDWQPDTKQLWGADNGMDWRGDSLPPEELNHIIEGGDYGWPQVFGKQQVDETREDPMGTTKAAYAKTTEPAVMIFPAHSAPIDFKFIYTKSGFPNSYVGDALVCWHGSWNREHPEGYKVQCIRFENGMPVSATDFFSGFLSGDKSKRFGRPAGLCFAGNGRLYISDDENGVIYLVHTTNKKG